jgi:hypothetical protein
LSLIGAGSVGLLAGLISRLFLRDWKGATRFLSALLALLTWKVTADIAQAIWSGSHPFEYLTQVDNWIEAGQLAIGCLSILAISLAGQRTRETVPSQKSNTETAHRTPLRWGLSLSLAMAAVAGLGLGFLQAYTGRLTGAPPPLALPLAGAGVMGLLLGVTARLTLRGRTETLKALLPLLALLLWIVAAELAYAAWSGLHPLYYLAEANNWIEMGQLAIGYMAAIVGGVVRRPPVPVEVTPAPRRRRKAESPVRKARKPRPAAQASRERRRKTSLPRFRLPVRPRRQPAPTNANSEVKVIAKNEDRCPYCLDVIEAKDPRGVVVCEICGTPHHADCWAAGGRCQVPHLIT